MQVNRPTGSSSVTFFRLLPVAPTILSCLPDCCGRRVFGAEIDAAAGQVVAGQRQRVGDDFGGRALGDDRAAMHPGAGADVDDVVGQRMASSSCSTTSTVLPMSRRFLKRLQQAVVVALVQADGGFVEDVHDAGQPRADLRGQPDALRFAA